VEESAGKGVFMSSLCRPSDHSLQLGSCDCSNWGCYGTFGVKLGV